METEVYRIGNELASVLLNLQNITSYLSIDIDCSLLDEDRHWKQGDIRSSAEFKDLFEALGETERKQIPVLYVFEIVSVHTAQEIRAVFQAYANSKTNQRKTPAYYGNFDESSRTLYVGKTLGGFWARLIEHLGVHEKEKNHGLQLLHWAKDIKLQLKLHVFKFSEQMRCDSVMLALEKEVAQQRNPIIGKH
jgi:hypothetical protein